MDLSLLPSWIADFAFVVFLFGMFYWLVSRTDKMGEKIHGVLDRLAGEFHTHQVQDAESFGMIKAALEPRKPRRKAKAK